MQMDSKQTGLWKCLPQKTKGSLLNIDTSKAAQGADSVQLFTFKLTAITLCSMMATKTISWTLVWDVEAAAPSATPSAGGEKMMHFSM